MAPFRYTKPVSNFVGKERKAELIADHEAFEIVKVVKRNSKDFGEQYNLSVLFQDESEGVMTFSAESNVFTRDSMLEQLATYLEETGDSQIGYLRKEGQTILIDIEGSEVIEDEPQD